MRQNGRRHRILKALVAGPLRLAELKRRAHHPDLERAADRAATWSTVCAMADEDLVTLAGGAVTVTAMGLAQLETAERVWAQQVA